MAIHTALPSDLRSEKADEDVYGAAIGLTEIGLGSLLHALHVPLCGTLLSLNQIFLLTCSLTRGGSRSWSPFLISTRAALLKALSPIGKTFTPMLAICMQGFLYALGTVCFGNTLVGRCTGALLSSCWGFCQPLLFYRLLFGPSFFEALRSFAWVEGLFWGVVVAKLTVTLLIVLCAPLIPTGRLDRYVKRITHVRLPQSQGGSPASGAMKDLCSPFFLFSLLLTAFFLYFSEGVTTALLWGVLRPLALGYVFFLLLRILPRRKHGE